MCSFKINPCQRVSTGGKKEFIGSQESNKRPKFQDSRICKVFKIQVFWSFFSRFFKYLYWSLMIFNDSLMIFNDSLKILFKRLWRFFERSSKLSLKIFERSLKNNQSSLKNLWKFFDQGLLKNPLGLPKRWCCS